MRPRSHVRYCMKRVAMLKHFGVIPVMVFDGAPLPSKLAKEHERLASREENKAKGMELLRDGHRARAMDHFQKCIDITPELAYQLIEVQSAVTGSALFPDKPIQRTLTVLFPANSTFFPVTSTLAAHTIINYLITPPILVSVVMHHMLWPVRGVVSSMLTRRYWSGTFAAGMSAGGRGGCRSAVRGRRAAGPPGHYQQRSCRDHGGF